MIHPTLGGGAQGWGADGRVAARGALGGVGAPHRGGGPGEGGVLVAGAYTFQLNLSHFRHKTHHKHSLIPIYTS